VDPKILLVSGFRTSPRTLAFHPATDYGEMPICRVGKLPLRLQEFGCDPCDSLGAN
jgi:hypothetical protein